MLDDNATVTGDSPSSPDSEAPHPHLALIVTLCTTEPDRLGEVLFVPQGSRRVFGRGGPRPDDPCPRVGLVRLRPGRTQPMSALRSPWLSRRQLELQQVSGGLRVERTGRAVLQVDGREVDEAVLQAGQVFEVGAALQFLCVLLPDHLPELPNTELHPVGRADAGGLVGESPILWELRRQLALLSPRSQHVLLRGESGSGKELVARALHRGCGGPLISRNAATLPEGLIDAELFGNVSGYPNPGMRERSGLIGAAAGGVLFLDEIAELPESLQAHLLRVLDGGEYQRLGEARMRRADFRLIAATNRPESALKHDVLARFPLRLTVPPLRERRADIPLVVRHLLAGIAKEAPDLEARFFDDGHARIAPELMRVLIQQDHPENVRGLRTTLWSSVIESSGDTLELPSGVAQTQEDGWTHFAGMQPASLPPAAVQACLDAHNGNQEQTFRALGLDSRHVLARFIKRHGLVVRRSG